jgi:cellulose synthase operon protein C
VRRRELPATVLLLALASGCATADAARRAEQRAAAAEAAGWAAWRALLEGASGKAEVLFREARTAQPEHPLALFGEAALAFERGRTEAALDATFALLALAEQQPTDRWVNPLATAAATRLTDLLSEAASPRPFEDRVLALPARGLSWRARLAIEEARDNVARRRGEGALLRGSGPTQGCLSRMQWLGSAGSFPNLDLAQPLSAGRASPRPIEASGCILILPEREGRPGVHVLQAPITATAGRVVFVLDYAGPALIRIDGRPFVEHGSARTFGPRASAVSLDLAPGRHTVELRLGSYGGAAQLRAFLFDPAPPEPAPPIGSRPEQKGLWELLTALQADAAGETDRALAAAQALQQRPRFTLGLAAAAGVLARDPTRPSGMARDEADALYRAVVARDPGFARVALALARAELHRDRSTDAAELARQARAAAPRFWPAAATEIEALRARGLERHADEVLEQTLAQLGVVEGACDLLVQAHQRAQIRYQTEAEKIYADRLQRCDARSTVPIEWLKRRGNLAHSAAALQQRLSFVSDRTGTRAELAAVRLAMGDAAAAASELAALVEAAPRDSGLRLRLADAYVAAGQSERARAVVADTVARLPGQASVRQVARVMGLPLPIEQFRLDGKTVIQEYRASKVDYAAPAVLVLDRTVSYVLEDGTQVILTHNIVNVKTKDGIARWGEVEVPDSAEILALRTHKADGRVREPEEISGKETISAPDLGPGDFVEWETVEYREPEPGLAPGFIGDRFYFQSLELPLHLSEYLVLAPAALALEFDGRAGAPAPEVGSGPTAETRLYRFVARKMPQLFGEPASVGHIEWIPSVRASSRIGIERWARMLADGLFGLTRGSPALRGLAQRVVAGVDRRNHGWEGAIVRWARDNIEAEVSLGEPATATVARGRGNRAAVIVALARALGLDADLVLARPVSEAPTDEAPVDQELDDFGEVLVRFSGGDAGAAPLFVDPRWKHAPLGYLPPALDGARCLSLLGGGLETARSRSQDGRSVHLELRLEPDGSGKGLVRETLRGWPAIEWASVHERLRGDQSKLRQDFEQRWLNHHFPGARLEQLAMDIDKSREGEAVLRYSFSSAGLASRYGGELRLVPTFFRSQPGRRFATESQRRTPLLAGADPPLDLEVEIHLPAQSTVLDVGREGTIETGQGEALRFSERRQILLDRRGSPATARVLIRRSAQLPLLRVAPAEYPAVASELRRVDSLEQGEIRIGSPPPGGGKTSATPDGPERRTVSR